MLQVETPKPARTFNRRANIRTHSAAPNPMPTHLRNVFPRPLHIPERFHIVQHLNQAVDEVRRAESTRLRGKPLGATLKKMRGKLLRRGSRVRGQARIKLQGLLESKMATGRAWDLKECFDPF
jgi:transposase